MKNRKVISVAIALVAVIAVSGVAYAFWTAGGTGSGSAQAGTTVNVVVHQTGAAITGLYPGGTPQALSGNFDNSNAGPVHITSVTAAVASVTLAGGNPGPCATGNFAVGGASNTPITIPAGSGVGSWSGLTIALLDSGINQDGCKGATVNLTYTANP